MPNDGHGFAVAWPGALNGDGRSDLAIGRLGAASDNGAVAVYHATAAGSSAAPDRVLRAATRVKLGFVLAGTM